RRTVDRVTERSRREASAARNEVQIARHAMVGIVHERRDRLARSRSIKSVAAATCPTRNQRALDLLLQIENRFIALRFDVAAKRCDFTPCRSRHRCLTPAPQRKRDCPAYVRTHVDQ